MRTLALLGGMTYSSTSLYYNLINQIVQSRLGPRVSAPLYLYSVNQEIMLQYASTARWDDFAQVFVHAAKALKAGGADAVVICASLAHKAADAVEQKAGVKVLHIADFVAAAVKAKGLSRIGIFGTKVVMEDECIKGRLEKKHGLDIVVPSPEDRELVNRLVVEELTTGKVSSESRQFFIKTAKGLIEQGAEGIILGSTDLGFVVTEENVKVPLFDTATLHATGVAEWAISDGD
ncbi:MAG: hypothetical protein M1820_009228 [Bogoriella megaspora]|nr:MAG: hypothetical protein M1820_009228 [Bogoriella megaspora]